MGIHSSCDHRAPANETLGHLKPIRHEVLEQKRLLWIDWGRNLRSQTLSRRLGVLLEQVCYDGGRWGRYMRSGRRTVAIIHRIRPDVVIATNPSIVLGILLLFLRGWYGFKLVSDAHHGGVTTARSRRCLQRLVDFHNAHVDLAIVTNETHARFLASLGTPAYVCQDPLPDIPKAVNSRPASGHRSVFLISSFDADEPYEAAFEAFRGLQKDGFALFVSGNYRKAKTDLSRFPWVNFLGFLPTDEYYAYLRSASIVMDLTTMENCLVCGAYEALAAGKPLIVSRTVALSEYFGDAVVLTDNTSEAIRESVLSAFAQRDQLVQRTRDWVGRNDRCMEQKIAGLRALLLTPNGNGRPDARPNGDGRPHARR